MVFPSTKPASARPSTTPLVESSSRAVEVNWKRATRGRCAGTCGFFWRRPRSEQRRMPEAAAMSARPSQRCLRLRSMV